ncbi:MAG: HNH endonuclease signature motif containing protein [Candidatus Woesearchaeota archaeon]
MKMCKYPGCVNYLEDTDPNNYCFQHKQFEQQYQNYKQHIKNIKFKSFITNKKYYPNILLRNSPQWIKIKKEMLGYYDHCIVCGSTNHLEVHHIVKPNGDPTLFYDKNNLVVLCKSCHQKITDMQNRGGGYE